MNKYPFEKCKLCEHPVRLVDTHGKTIGRRCYFQLDTMKEAWDEEDCQHFFEPKKSTNVSTWASIRIYKEKAMSR